MTSKKKALKVVFVDDGTQEDLCYSGETLLAPLSQLSNWMLTGTPISFCPVSVSDKLWSTKEGNELHQTITVMDIYSDKSIEELRLEDYNVKKPNDWYSRSHFSRTPFVSKVEVHGSSKDSSFVSQGLSFGQAVESQQLFKQSTTKIKPVRMSITTSAEDSDGPYQLPKFSFSSTPSMNFSSTSDPSSVFAPVKLLKSEKEPLSALTVAKKERVRDDLLQSIVKCMQIQSSLYRLVLLKLQLHVTAEAATDNQAPSQNSTTFKDKSSKPQLSSQGANNSPSALLCELKMPMEALMHCASIQRSLFEKLLFSITPTTNSEDDQGIESYSSGMQDSKPKVHVNMITFQYDLEEITFKKKMECNYIRNPFSDLHVTSTSEDVVHHVFVRDKCFVSVGAAAKRLPHGSGILKTSTGKVLYSGEWCKGKRHGNGEASIYAASCTVGDSTAQHGYYTGAWKHNMRHGRGKMYFTSGAVYDGQWKFDKMTGHGTLKLPDGSIQEGSWRDGKLHGCAVFTWPHGVCEYREYDEKQGQLRSCHIKEENLESISLKSSFYSQLMNLQECVNKLKDDKGILTEQLNAFEEDHAKTAGKVMASLCRLQEWKDDMRKNQEEFNTKLKETESKSADKIRTLENELEQSQNAQLCQICFERSRDCIIMPCTHLLYCRMCVSEHKMKGVNRCPSCRGPISGEILCNINHS
ncbi:uncharacterized protein LOC141883770 isoform X1 [Acropora palmata]|uniref:uncharacterized protein LOC141883770 isoform X1 n=1 Tax=Acropora palmata TaxID=6131 RepID=UPI003DA1921F